MSEIFLTEPGYITERYKNSRDISYLLFAQDLVNYVISSCDPSFQMRRFVENSSQHHNSAFTNSVKNAINCIFFYAHRKNRYPFKWLKETGDGIYMKYLKCVEKLDDNYFSTGFHVTNFLYFCVDIAIMSFVFYKSGMQEAPSVTVIYILRKLESRDQRKYLTLLNSVAEEFPGVSRNALNNALNRLKDDFEFSLSPFKEISEPLRSEESSGGCSKSEIIKFALCERVTY